MLMSDLIHIIAVDDEDDMNVLFKHFFRNEIKQKIITLSFAASAKECLSILENNEHKNVKVITDINMPDTNGIVLAAKIRETYPWIEVYLVSAYSIKDVQSIINFEKFQYIPKPINFNELKKIIKL